MLVSYTPATESACDSRPARRRFVEEPEFRLGEFPEGLVMPIMRRAAVHDAPWPLNRLQGLLPPHKSLGFLSPRLSGGSSIQIA